MDHPLDVDAELDKVEDGKLIGYIITLCNISYEDGKVTL